MFLGDGVSKLKFFTVMSACLLLSLVLLPSAAFAAESAYQINPGDVLQVFVWNEETLSRDGVIVQPDGNLSFPLVGDLVAAGHTTTEVSQAIASGLQRFLKDKPVVNVSLVRVDGNMIFVLGKVIKPGAFVASRSIDVMQALALAGGLTPYAGESGIKILRRDSAGKQQSISFKYSDVKSGDNLEKNIILKSGDIVVVP